MTSVLGVHITDFCRERQTMQIFSVWKRSHLRIGLRTVYQNIFTALTTDLQITLKYGQLTTLQQQKITQSWHC